MGASHGIDDVVLPEHWIPSVSSSHIWDDLDLLAGTDHRPVAVTVTVSTQALPQVRQWPTFRLDQKSLRDLVARQEFINGFQSAIQVPWEVSIEDHYAILVDHFDSSAKAAFTQMEQHKYEAYFMEDTINLVCARESVSALLDKVPAVITPEDMVF